jgi:type IV secretion system protein VirB1
VPDVLSLGMDAATFATLAMACAPLVHPGTAHAVVAVESSVNPHAIGVVGGALGWQPRNRSEALATAIQLHTDGWNFSVGLAQINVRNFDRLGLTVSSAFDPCENLRAMQAVLGECFARAGRETSPRPPIGRALSCYYSGNFATGFDHGYVRRVAAAARANSTPTSRPP